MGCLRLTYEPEFFLSIAGDHEKTLARTKNRTGTHNYKYNGKELQTELGLNFYDYGARNYDAALGRWMNIDPLAEKYLEVSSYIYCLNNPVFFIDPDGMQVDNTYGVDNNGNIKKIDDKKYYDSNGKEIDKLVSLDSKGNKTNKSVDVEKDVLKGISSSKSSDGTSYDYFFTKRNDNTIKLFEFLATETSVEWSITTENDKDSWIATSHSKSSESGGSAILGELLSEREGQGNSYEHIHSHPKEGGIPGYSGPSGFDKRDKNYGVGDKKFSKWIKTNYSKEFVKTRVYDAKTKEYILYDDKGSINRKKSL